MSAYLGHTRALSDIHIVYTNILIFRLLIDPTNMPYNKIGKSHWSILQPLGNDSLNDSLDTVTKTNSIPSEEFEEEYRFL